MRKLFTAFLIIIAVTGLAAQKKAIIIDHNCISLDKVPESYLEEAKGKFRIAYQHTSHGSQLPSGMKLISNPACSYGTGEGQLYFRDYGISGASDLGNPDRTKWAEATRNLLNNNTNNINMIMWSWCGQVSSATQADIEQYLSLMSQLESDFPGVTFVYMTGHLDGTGEGGNLNQRNEQIRTFCKNNGKVLFDFANIESYDPEGNYYLDKKGTDSCHYYEGNIRRNWAFEWCEKNPDKCGSFYCAHTPCLNCQMKSYGFWWMMARVSGWEGLPVDVEGQNPESSELLEVFPNPVTSEGIIEYNIQNENNYPVLIKICDVFGNCVDELRNLPAEPGRHKLNYNSSKLASGYYFARMNCGNYIAVRQFVISK